MKSKLGKLLFKPAKRVSTGIAEIDELLGGGLVLGSTTVLAGPRGVGKTAFAARVAVEAACKGARGARVMYASGEESRASVIAVAQRQCGATRALNALGARLEILGEANDLHEILAQARQKKIGLLIVDSLQTVCRSDVKADFGTPFQVKAVVEQLVAFGREHGVAILALSQVNRKGAAAGAQAAIELLADTVGTFYRRDNTGLAIPVNREIVVCKNRHGHSGVVMLRMTDAGRLELFVTVVSKGWIPPPRSCRRRR